MSPYILGFFSAALIFVGGLVGLALQRCLPSHHLSKEMQDLVKLSAGMIGTLTALVLGLLVSSAKGSFDTINSGILQGSAKIIYLDQTLLRYGSETAPVRLQLKEVIRTGLINIWPEERGARPALAAFEGTNGIGLIQDALSTLTPRSPVQQVALNQAQQITSDLGQNHWLLVEEIHNQLPTPLLLILVFWLFLLFVSFGLFAPRNLTALIVLGVGACAVSGAVFLVLELNQPFDGLIRVSPEPLRNALQHLGTES